MNNQHSEVVETNTSSSEDCLQGEKATLSHSNVARSSNAKGGVAESGGVVLADDCYYSADEDLQFENEEMTSNVSTSNAVLLSSISSSFGKFSTSGRKLRSSALLGKWSGAKQQDNDRDDAVGSSGVGRVDAASNNKKNKGYQQYSSKLFKIVEKGILRKEDGRVKSELSLDVEDEDSSRRKSGEFGAAETENSIFRSRGGNQGDGALGEDCGDLGSRTREELNLLLLSEAKKGNAELVSRILAVSPDSGGRLDVDRGNDGGFTALHWASLYGHSMIVKKLLNSNANPSITTKMNCTPLHFASANGFDEIVSSLLQFGAETNVVSELGFTPLSSASFRGHEKTVRLLIKSGACLDYRDKGGLTPKDLAESNGHLEVARLLEEAMALSKSRNSGNTQNEAVVGRR